jgi:hypothetical protein
VAARAVESVVEHLKEHSTDNRDRQREVKESLAFPGAPLDAKRLSYSSSQQIALPWQ